MKFDINIHLHAGNETELMAELVKIGRTIFNLREFIMTSQAQLAADLTTVKDQVAKIGAETTVTLQKVADLEAAIGNAGEVTPEVEAALAALKEQVNLVDGLVPDAAS